MLQHSLANVNYRLLHQAKAELMTDFLMLPNNVEHFQPEVDWMLISKCIYDISMNDTMGHTKHQNPYTMLKTMPTVHIKQHKKTHANTHADDGPQPKAVKHRQGEIPNTEEATLLPMA